MSADGFKRKPVFIILVAIISGALVGLMFGAYLKDIPRWVITGAASGLVSSLILAFYKPKNQS